MTKIDKSKKDRFEIVLSSFEQRVPRLSKTSSNKVYSKKMINNLLISIENLSQEEVITSIEFKDYYDRILKLTEIINEF